MRDIQLSIAENGEVSSRGVLLCTMQPGDHITLETPGGMYFMTIHRETSPGRRAESRPKRQPAQIRKLHIVE